MAQVILGIQGMFAGEACPGYLEVGECELCGLAPDAILNGILFGKRLPGRKSR